MNVDAEEWLHIPEWPEYEVSNLGRVRRGGHVLRPTAPKCGYFKVTLCARGSRQDRQVSELVLTTFEGPRPTHVHEAAHEDGNKANNRRDNLSWKVPTANRQDKWRHGTMRSALTAEQVEEIEVLLAQGISQAELSRRYNVHNDTIHRIDKRRKQARAEFFSLIQQGK